ncbi:MAG: nucleotide exchange factor GrpE [Solirubrobacterales bacterium]
MTTSINDIISDGTDGRGEASAGSRTSFGRANSDPAEAETDSGSTSGLPPSSSEGGGSATPAATSPEANEAGGEGGDEPQLDETELLRQERDKYLDLARRSQADFENLKKRSARELGEARSKAIANFVRELLPVVDNVDRALEAARAGGATDADALLQGVALVHAELHGFLDRLGLTPIDSVGDVFDPNIHEALASVPADGAEPGTVTEVHQRGFMLGDAVVRPARVVVAA